MPRDSDGVMVCERCGTGFLVAQPQRIHQFPRAMFLAEAADIQPGTRCMGTIRVISRASAIRFANGHRDAAKIVG